MTGASSELFEEEGKQADSAVAKKLKQPKKRRQKKKKKVDDAEKKDKRKESKKDKKEEAAVDGSEEDEEEVEEEDEDEGKGGVGSLMIVKTAAEAWERLRERLKEGPIIQVRTDNVYEGPPSTLASHAWLYC